MDDAQTLDRSSKLLEEALKSSQTNLVKRSDKFAARLSMTQPQEENGFTDEGINPTSNSGSVTRPRGDSQHFVDKKQVNLISDKPQ